MRRHGVLDGRPTAAVPPLGGFSFGVLMIEVRRLLRNRRTLLFTIGMPVMFFLLFGLNKSYAGLRAGHGNVAAFIMISMALYGAVLSTTGGGAVVSLERAAGWSRQLRVTPLTPAAHIATKMLAAMVLGFIAVAAVFAAGLITHKPVMSGSLWVASGLAVWGGSLLFTACGLCLGYLLPSENVMQVMSFVLVFFAFGGGLFIPLSQFPPIVQTLAHYTPLYGLNQLVHWPLMGGALHASWLANAAVWLLLFAGGASWLFRRDTARV